MEVELFSQSVHATDWTRICTSSSAATFLHSREFLEYHGSRYRDISIVIRKSGDVIGVMPLALDPSDPKHAISHPGATFGGLMHCGGLSGSRCTEAYGLLVAQLRELDVSRLTVKPVPHIYHVTPAQDELYALFRLDARRSRCGLSSAIDLQNRRQPSERRRRSLIKARKRVEVMCGHTYLEALWDIVEGNLADRHDTKPTHTRAEIIDVVRRVGEQVDVVVALEGADVVAGVLVFKSRLVHHAQYIASSALGFSSNALDAVFEHCIRRAEDVGARYFDFGTSNEDADLVLNEGLYSFKSEFGGGGVAYEQYIIDFK